MKTILSMILLAFPIVAFADYVDVIEYKLNDGCKFETELQIMRDFNSQWGAKYGYNAENLAPVQSQNLVSFYWVGHTKDAATFGKAWDAWRNETQDPSTVAGKLLARFAACTTNLSRRGYDVYK
jgi:hypothetical protein